MIFFTFHLKESLKSKTFVYKAKDKMHMHYLRNSFLEICTFLHFLHFDLNTRMYEYLENWIHTMKLGSTLTRMSKNK